MDRAFEDRLFKTIELDIREVLVGAFCTILPNSRYFGLIRAIFLICAILSCVVSLKLMINKG